MATIFKKIWTELNRVRKIEFLSFETEQEEDERLASELKARILEIKKENSERICKKLAQLEIDSTLYKQNYIMPYKQALSIAVARFIQAKKDGKIDKLNSVIGEG